MMSLYSSRFCSEYNRGTLLLLHSPCIVRLQIIHKIPVVWLDYRDFIVPLPTNLKRRYGNSDSEAGGALRLHLLRAQKFQELSRPGTIAPTSKEGMADSETAVQAIYLKKGDVNMDGIVSVADAVSVVEIIMDNWYNKVSQTRHLIILEYACPAEFANQLLQ